MSREEAIDYLTILRGTGNITINEAIALKIAIEALDQEPKTNGSYHPVISGNVQNPPKVKSAER